MGKIAVIAREDVAALFRWAGVRDSFSVNTEEEARELLYKLAKDPKYTLIIVGASIAEKIVRAIELITAEQEYPLIITIPERGVTPSKRIDPLRELLRRALGIEIK
ncbi:MAG: hypothetical protein DRJ49_04500 [Thermoprotei archaeon]|nr:MAG: hypothetical protein DRJ49_04500 [Thermoprotei archaeon]